MADTSKKTIFTRIAGLLLISGVVVYAVFQMLSLFSKDVEIARLREYTTEIKSESTAVFFRDETVITSVSGSCEYETDDLSRVATGDRLAVIYAASGSAAFSDRLSKLEAQLDSLEDIYKSGSLFDYDVTRLDKQINATVYSVLECTDRCDAAAAQPLIRELAKLLNKRSIVDGGARVTQEQIDAVRSEIASVTQSGANVLATVNSPCSGFFTSNYDGLEGQLPFAAAEGMTVDTLNAYAARKPADGIPADYVGTVIKGFEWKCAFTAPAALGLTEGKLVRLRFPDYSDTTIRVRIESVSSPQDGRCAVVVSSTEEIGLHTGAHIQSVEIIASRYSGLYVDKDAVKYEDGVTGVYVIKGQVLVFRPVEIVYSGEGYVLLTAAEGSTLSKSDDVVVSGRDLYNNKIVKSG